MGHAFGELLTQYRNRKQGLSQARLAQIVGYDPAVIARMAQGTRDLTGPSGRERIVRIISALCDEGVLHSLDEANALLAAAEMPPLYTGLPAEARLIQRCSPAVASTPAVTWTTRHGVPHNLPTLLTSFVGREQEITELIALSRATRLLTLTGAGGVGKSRLAMQVASEKLTQSHAGLDLADGVWLIQLASLNNPLQIADAIAIVLGLRPSGQPTLAILLEYLRDKRMMLILDNCEHLIHDCSVLAETLLQACPHLHMIATSRELLNIAGEIVWRVPPMTRETALQLFEDRGRTVSSGFQLSMQDERLVAHICERLDGMPLAIELAVARLRTLSIEQIAARLDDRFRLLTDGYRTALPRHGTLRAMIDWSYGLLSESERSLLCKVSVFAGGWSIESVEAMCENAGTLDQLAHLVSKSLVNMRNTPLGARYSLHETIRQYAHDKLVELDELNEVQSRHAMACLLLVTTTREMIQFVDQQRWVEMLEMERDNIYAALDWCLSDSGDPGLGARIAINLGGIWLQSHRLEGLRWMRRLIKTMPASLPLELRGPITLEYAYLMDSTRPAELRHILQQLREMYSREDPENVIVIEILSYQALIAHSAEESCALMEEAVAISLGSQMRHAPYWIHYYLGLHLGPLGWRLDMAGTKGAFEDFLVVTTEAHDSFGQALSYEGLMYVAFYEMALALAAALASQVLTWAEPVNAEMPILSALHCLAEIALMEGRLEDAKSYIDASLDHNAKYGHMAAAAQGLGLKMRLAMVAGDFPTLKSCAAKLRAYTTVPDVWTMGNASVLLGVDTLAAAAITQGDYVRGTRLFGAAEAERERRHNLWWPKDHAQLDTYIDASRQHMGEEAFKRVWAEGLAMSLDQAIAIALD